MSEFEENIINDEELQEVSGGTATGSSKGKTHHSYLGQSYIHFSELQIYTRRKDRQGL